MTTSGEATSRQAGIHQYVTLGYYTTIQQQLGVAIAHGSQETIGSLAPLRRPVANDSNQRTHVRQREGSTGLDDWACVFPLKNFEFDHCLVYSQILDDKAISTYKDHWDQVYDPTLFGYTTDKGVETGRVMLEVLNRTDINIKSMMGKVMQRQVPDNWKVV
uniref:RdRp catalytic domain-containing protein n=1 Tax=Trichuris muris TaxID=70415 RepID=A0A5S6Q114_TRIMR